MFCAFRLKVTAVALSTSALSLMVPQPAAAQQYPSQQVTIIVAAAAGGFADGVARSVGEKLSERLGQRSSWRTRPGQAAISARVSSRNRGRTVIRFWYRRLRLPSMVLSTRTWDMRRRTFDLWPSSARRRRRSLFIRAIQHKISLSFSRWRRPQASNTEQPVSGPALLLQPNTYSKVSLRCRPCTCRFRAGHPVLPRFSAIMSALSATVSPLIVHINASKLRGLGIARAKRYPVVPSVPTYAENGIVDFHAALG